MQKLTEPVSEKSGFAPGTSPVSLDNAAATDKPKFVKEKVYDSYMNGRGSSTKNEKKES